jgi:arylsulfatase A-like enzyme
MFTGLHPWQHGVTRNGQVLGEGLETLAEALHAAGFATQAVVSSFPVASRFGFRQGFDGYVEEFTHDFMHMTTWEGQALPSPSFYAPAETVTKHALAALDAAQAPRQFYWFHYFDPHAPYGSSLGKDVTRMTVLGELSRDPSRKQALLEEVRELYRADVTSMDRSLDQLLTRLEADRQRFQTHVMIVSDHGESLGEGDSLGHGVRLQESEIRVPALLLSPALASGLRHDTAGSVDVAATMIRFAGLPPLPASVGRDLSIAAPEAGVVYGMRRTFVVSPQFERRLDGRDHRLPDLEFYSVRGEGPYVVGSSRGVDHAGAGVDSEAREAFRGFERELSRHATTAVDENTARALEALGYAQ